VSLGSVTRWRPCRTSREVARDRVDRLDAAVDQDGQPAKADEVVLGLVARRAQRVGHGHDGEQENRKWEPAFHDLLRLDWAVAASVSEWKRFHSLTLAATRKMKWSESVGTDVV